MDWIQQTVRDFGDTLGIEDLEFDASQGIELMLDSGVLVGISCLPSQEMLVYATAPLDFDPLSELEQALRLSNARYGDLPPVQVAISNNQLVLAIRLSTREFDLPALDEAVGRLVDMQHQVSQNAF